MTLTINIIQNKLSEILLKPFLTNSTKVVMNKVTLVTIIAILLIISYLLISNVTGLLVFTATEEIFTATNYCGDGECDDDEDCGRCAADCSLCRLRAEEVNVSLEWRELYRSDNATGLCGEYDKGSVYVMIELSDEIKTGVYFCTAEFDGPQTSFSVRSPGNYVLFAADMSLKQDQTGEVCCHSYSVNPDFCKTITLAAYC